MRTIFIPPQLRVKRQPIKHNNSSGLTRLILTLPLLFLIKNHFSLFRFVTWVVADVFVTATDSLNLKTERNKVWQGDIKSEK